MRGVRRRLTRSARAALIRRLPASEPAAARSQGGGQAMRVLRGVFARRLAPMGVSALLAMWPGVSGPASRAVTLQPLVSDYVLLNSGTAPLSEAQCFARGRRCFIPTSIRNSYNLGPLYAQGL